MSGVQDRLRGTELLDALRELADDADAEIARLRSVLHEIGYFPDGTKRSSGPYFAAAMARAALKTE